LDLCPFCEPKENYELDRRTIDGNHLVEIIRNGKSWDSPWDQRFCFGPVKAKMALECMDLIRQFALSSAPGTMLEQPISRSPDPLLTIDVRTVPRFFNSRNQPVEEPFLEIARRVTGRAPNPFRFGQSKAIAIAVLEVDLKRWLISVGGWL
jgi:hypothetical protein